jgi:hypothetical protein
MSYARGSQKSSRNSLASTVRCTVSSYRLDRVLLCNFRRGSGRHGFCSTITHRASHRLLRHHPTTVLSGFCCSYSENRLNGTRFAPMEDIISKATAELRKIPKEAFLRCFQQSQDRWSKQHHAGWIVCRPLSVNVFVTLATQ